MFEIGWSEMLVVAVVALIVVGPKDLPRMMRSFGQWMGRLRNLAGQFQRSMDEAAREMDMQELRDAKNALTDLKSIRNPFDAAMKGVTDRLNALDRPRPVAPPPSVPAASAPPAPPAPAAPFSASAPEAAPSEGPRAS